MTQVKGLQSFSRRLALPILKGSFILISLKTPSVIYFRNPLSNWDSGEKVLKSFKEVGLAKSEKKLHPYFSEDPKCSMFSKSSWQLGFR